MAWGSDCGIVRRGWSDKIENGQRAATSATSKKIQNVAGCRYFTRIVKAVEGGLCHVHGVSPGTYMWSPCAADTGSTLEDLDKTS